MSKLEPGMRALVIGASGGIGRAMAMALGDRVGMGGVATLSRSADGLDIGYEASISAARDRVGGPFDMIFVATGGLTVGHLGPERTIKALSVEGLEAQFRLNAIGPALLLKHFHDLLPRDRRAVFAVLSARVGSIGDNRLGGWTSYRAAKSAVNQIVRTASIEIARKRPKAIVVALHPGTVRTEMTEKYLARHPSVSAEDCAQNLLNVMDGLTPE
ncbi:MAG: SDR family NAD(P)-dependent oxidoreductase, partial [Pseudomonadota bacterium]